jgi:hypothetical protein
MLPYLLMLLVSKGLILQPAAVPLLLLLLVEHRGAAAVAVAITPPVSYVAGDRVAR